MNIYIYIYTTKWSNYIINKLQKIDINFMNFFYKLQDPPTVQALEGECS